MRRSHIIASISLICVGLILLFTNAVTNVQVLYERHPNLEVAQANLWDIARDVINSSNALKDQGITLDRISGNDFFVDPLNLAEREFLVAALRRDQRYDTALNQVIQAWGDALAAHGLTTGVGFDLRLGTHEIHVVGENVPASFMTSGITFLKSGSGSTQLSQYITQNEVLLGSLKDPGAPSLYRINIEEDLLFRGSNNGSFQSWEGTMALSPDMFGYLDPQNLKDSPTTTIFCHELCHALSTFRADTNPSLLIEYHTSEPGAYSYFRRDEIVTQTGDIKGYIEANGRIREAIISGNNSEYLIRADLSTEANSHGATENAFSLLARAEKYNALAFEILSDPTKGTTRISNVPYRDNFSRLEIYNSSNKLIMRVPVTPNSPNPVGEAKDMVIKAQASQTGLLGHIVGAVDRAPDSLGDWIEIGLDELQSARLNIDPTTKAAMEASPVFQTERSTQTIAAQAEIGAAGAQVQQARIENPSLNNTLPSDPRLLPPAQQSAAADQVITRFGSKMSQTEFNEGVSAANNSVEDYLNTTQNFMNSPTYKTSIEVADKYVGRKMGNMGDLFGAADYWIYSLKESQYVDPASKGEFFMSRAGDFMSGIVRGQAETFGKSAALGGLGALVQAGYNVLASVPGPTPSRTALRLFGAALFGQNVVDSSESIYQFALGSPSRFADSYKGLEAAGQAFEANMRAGGSGLENFVKRMVNIAEGREVFQRGGRLITSRTSQPEEVPNVGLANGRIVLLPPPSQLPTYVMPDGTAFVGSSTFIEGLELPPQSDVLNSKFFVGGEATNKTYQNSNYYLTPAGTRIYEVPEGQIVYDPQSNVATYLNDNGIRKFHLDSGIRRDLIFSNGTTLVYEIGKAPREYNINNELVFRTDRGNYLINESSGALTDPNGATMMPVRSETTAGIGSWDYPDGSSFEIGSLVPGGAQLILPNASTVRDNRTDVGSTGGLFAPTAPPSGAQDGFGVAIERTVFGSPTQEQLAGYVQQAYALYRDAQEVQSGSSQDPAMSEMAIIARASSLLEQAEALKLSANSSSEIEMVAMIKAKAESALSLIGASRNSTQPIIDTVTSPKLTTQTEISSWTPLDAEDLAMGQAISVDLQNQDMTTAAQLNVKLAAADVNIPNLTPASDMVTTEIFQTGAMIDFTLNLPSQYSDSSAAALGASGSQPTVTLTPAQIDRLKQNILNSGQPYKTVNDAGKNYMIVTMPFEKGGFTVRIPL